MVKSGGLTKQLIKLLSPTSFSMHTHSPRDTIQFSKMEMEEML
jgi:hypothetical protein